VAAFDARYQEEVQAAAATNERFPMFSADHINDIKEAMRGISLPANAPAWAQVRNLSSQLPSFPCAAHEGALTHMSPCVWWCVRPSPRNLSEP
jgi:hypothetical protein